MFLIIVLFLFSASFANSHIPKAMLIDEFHSCKQDLEICGHSHSYKNQFSEKLLSNAADSTLNVLNYDLFLDWSPIFSGDDYALENKIYSGIQRIKFKKNKASNFIKLNAVDLEIDSIIYLNEKLTNFTHNDGILNISFEDSLIKYQIYDITIYFKNTGLTNKGFYLYPKGKIWYKEREYDNYEKLAATFSQPEMARNWMPCNDVPNDKAIAKITVKVPEGVEVASNGILIDKIKETIDSISYLTYVWEDKNHPISTYLMAVTASKYAVILDQYNRKGYGDTIPIMNYVWRQDSLGSFAIGDQYDAMSSLKVTPSIIRAYSDMFGEYVYNKYGHATLQPFDFGGMEHQTITSINRSWLRGTAELGIAHEIAHHWIGDLVTCDTWQDIWINEGGATWFEALWVYVKNLNNGENVAFEQYNKYFTDRSWRYLSEERLYDKVLSATPTSLIFNYSNLTYTKASWVYHMLYRRLGEEFLNFMTFIFEQKKFGNISTKDFENELAFFLNHYEINFNVEEFFNQIVYTSGHPAYYIFIDPDYSKGGNTDYKMKIQQVQEGQGFNEVYNYHLKVDCYLSGKLDTTFIVFNNQRIQEYDVTLNNKIDSINIDRSYTLCNVWANIVSVEEALVDYEEVKILPNPIISGNTVKLEIPNFGSDYKIEVYDMLGNLKLSDKIFSNNSSIIYNFETSNYSSGNYIVLIKSSDLVINKKFIILKN